MLQTRKQRVNLGRFLPSGRVLVAIRLRTADVPADESAPQLIDRLRTAASHALERLATENAAHNASKTDMGS